MGRVSIFPLMAVARSVLALIFASSAFLSSASTRNLQLKAAPEEAVKLNLGQINTNPFPEVEKGEIPPIGSSFSGELRTLRSMFTEDIALEDGLRQLSISPNPMYYQDKDGNWQEIDTRFTAADQGFTNFTNALNISSGERVATINLSVGETQVQWQPLGLEFIADGIKSPLAVVLDPASSSSAHLVDGNRTVRYPASWSLPEILEEVSVAPGVAEQKLILQSRPSSVVECPVVQQAVAGEAAGTCDINLQDLLVLSAVLRLSPGAVLTANGQVQVNSFRTEGRVEIRQSDKVVLVLDPVVAYEQQNPTEQVAGSYAFTLSGEGEWQVAVQTPLRWWADLQRHYPAVLDPTMKMLSPITTAALCDYSPIPLARLPIM